MRPLYNDYSIHNSHTHTHVVFMDVYARHTIFDMTKMKKKIQFELGRLARVHTLFSPPRYGHRHMYADQFLHGSQSMRVWVHIDNDERIQVNFNRQFILQFTFCKFVHIRLRIQWTNVAWHRHINGACALASLGMAWRGLVLMEKSIKHVKMYCTYGTSNA